MKRPDIDHIQKSNSAKAWGHVDSAVSHCAALLEWVRRLEAELAVRTIMHVWIVRRPQEFSGSGRRSAYDTGYEQAWRGLPMSNPYTQPHLRAAQKAGHHDGTEAAEAAIREHVARATPAAANSKAVAP